MSIAFTTYLDRIANSNDTDGALAAPIGFLFWVWLSMIDTILVDEINSQLDIRRQWIPQPGSKS